MNVGMHVAILPKASFDIKSIGGKWCDITN